jgi:hypothetical protein
MRTRRLCPGFKTLHLCTGGHALSPRPMWTDLRVEIAVPDCRTRKALLHLSDSCASPWPARDTRSIAGLERVVAGPICHFLDSSKLRPQSAGGLDSGCGRLKSRCRRASVDSVTLIAWTADRSMIACNCHSSQPAPIQQSCRSPIKTRCVPCRTIMTTSAKCV